MSESKHTPGPWTVEVFDSIETAKAYGCFEWSYTWPDECGRPAAVWQLVAPNTTTGLPGCIEVGEANARLIAAAPDLLAACEDALATCWDEMQYLHDNGRLRDVLCAAIQKAKGGDQ